MRCHRWPWRRAVRRGTARAGNAIASFAVAAAEPDGNGLALGDARAPAQAWFQWRTASSPELAVKSELTGGAERAYQPAGIPLRMETSARTSAAAAAARAAPTS